MSDEPSPTVAPSLTIPRLLVLLALALGATGAVIWFVFGRDTPSNENVVTVLDARASESVSVNVGEVLDATVPNNFTPELGRRYRVRITGESRDGASMIARIGSTVTFIKDVQVDEIVEVEVTRLHRTTAEAIVLNRTGQRAEPPRERPAYSRSAPATETVGEIYTGVVVRVGRLGDGLIKVDDQSVYVPGAQKGERVVFEVTEKRERFWNGRLIRKLAAEESGRPRPAEEAGTMRAPGVQVGGEFEVVVRERERRNPEKNGVARVDGLAVLIPDCQPGDRLKIRIVERLPTLAKAEIIERLPPESK